MILIITRDSINPSLNKIIDWLVSFDADFLRLNVDKLYNYDIVIDSCLKEINGIDLINECNIILPWINLNENFDETFSADFYRNNQNAINREVNSEIRSFLIILYEILKKKKWIFPLDSLLYFNKSQSVLNSVSVGFSIPNYIFTTRKNHVKQFQKENKHIVTKCIDDSSKNYLRSNSTDEYQISLTSLINNDEIVKFTDTFNISYFQSYVSDGEFEVRVFIIDDIIYSSSYYNSDVDRRTSKSVKSIRYQLPKEIEEKIILFVKSMRFLMCSFDFIRKKDGEFYLIDINPFGQFINEEIELEYNIAQDIALKLNFWDGKG